LYKKGHCKQEPGFFRRAREIYQLEAELSRLADPDSPGDPFILNNLALANLHGGDPAEAFNILQRAISYCEKVAYDNPTVIELCKTLKNNAAIAMRKIHAAFDKDVDAFFRS
jgi:hypothetical protein